jgi:hypothetical protein
LLIRQHDGRYTSVTLQTLRMREQSLTARQYCRDVIRLMLGLVFFGRQRRRSRGLAAT